MDIILKLDKALAYEDFNEKESKKEYSEVLDILYDYFIKSNKGLEKNQLFVRIMKGKLSVYKENQMICNAPGGYFKRSNMNFKKLELFENILNSDDANSNLSLCSDGFVSNEDTMDLKNDENKDTRKLA